MPNAWPKTAPGGGGGGRGGSGGNGELESWDVPCAVKVTVEVKETGG